MIRLWHWWCFGCGVVAVAALAAWPFARNISESQPVSLHYEQILLTPQIRPGDQLKFTIKVDRLQTCGGHMADVYFRNYPDRRVRIDRERRLISTALQKNHPVPTALDLPPTVMEHPGVWCFKTTLESTCPNYKRSDPIFDFCFEVLP